MICPFCRRNTEAVHETCIKALDARLQSVPVLYAELAVVLAPGSSAGTRVSGTRTPPLPLRLEPLSLQCRGGIVSILGTWESDWRARRGLAPDNFTGREHLLVGGRQLGHAVDFLRTYLDWAATNHPAVDEFADEIREIIAACRRALGLTTDLRRIGQCPAQLDDRTCGRVLYADPYADEIHCDRCHTVWPRPRWPLLGAAMAGNAA